MPRRHSLLVMILLCVLQLLVCPSLSQLALASSRYIQPPPAKRSSPYGYRDSHSRRLLTKLSDLKPLDRINSSGIESEIAAIFKGVAYGSSTPSTTTTERSSSTTSPPEISSSARPVIGVTDPVAFIGKQKKVHLSIGSTSETFQTSDHRTYDIIDPTPDSVVLSKNKTAYKFLTQSEISSDGDADIRAIEDVRSTPHYPKLKVGVNEPIKEVQVRITSAIRNKGLEGVKLQIGRAWDLHVYSTGIIFALIAVICLLSLSRINACCQMLPRGYFITLHLMLFLASFFRSILFFHDPYGAYDRLPVVLTALLFNTVDPCLTTAFAVMLLVLLRGARMHIFPFNIQSPLVLAIICGIHIGSSVVVDVSSGVLDDPSLIESLSVATQSVTAAWGSILCVGYVISFSSIEKAAQKLSDDFTRLTLSRGQKVESCSLPRVITKSSLTYAARLFLICSLLHGLLITFIILSLVTNHLSKSPTSSEAWAWWTQTTLERILEVSLSVLLLGATLVLTQPKPRLSGNKKEEKIFSIFDTCRRNVKGSKSVDVYPVANEKCNILGNGMITHSSPSHSLNYCANGWKQFNTGFQDHSLKKPITLNSIDAEFQKIMQSDSNFDKSYIMSQQLSNNCILRHQAEKERNFIPCAIYNEEPLEFQHYTKNNCLTLPGNRYYCSQQITTPPEKESKFKSKTITPNKSPNGSMNTLQNKRFSNDYMCKPSVYATSPTQYENEYDVASYYTNSNASTSSNLYSHPYSQLHCHSGHTTETNLRAPLGVHSKLPHHRNYDMEPRSEVSACSSHSEIQVDYLTDASSIDGLQGSLSRSLTLPISAQHSFKDRCILENRKYVDSSQAVIEHEQTFVDSVSPSTVVSKPSPNSPKDLNAQLWNDRETVTDGTGVKRFAAKGDLVNSDIAVTSKMNINNDGSHKHIIIQPVTAL